MDVMDQVVDVILKSKSVVFFGGAGVSTESGIPDFRSVDGIYSLKYPYPPEEIVSHSFFMERPKEFYEFYKDRMVYPDAKPNVTHEVLAKLEDKGILSAIVTQNIDGLHQMAGSKNVIELHGSIQRNTCMRCGKRYDLSVVVHSDGIPRCSCGGMIKPDVVLYEESLNEVDIEQAVEVIQHADTLIIAGTSLAVYPAAGFVRLFKGEHLILLNKSVTPMDEYCEYVVHDSMGKVFEKIKERIEKA